MKLMMTFFGLHRVFQGGGGEEGIKSKRRDFRKSVLYSYLSVFRPYGCGTSWDLFCHASGHWAHDSAGKRAVDHFEETERPGTPPHFETILWRYDEHVEYFVTGYVG